MNRGTPAIAGVIAGIATDVHVKDVALLFLRAQAGLQYLRVARTIGSFANGAKHTNQTLRQHAVQTGNEIVGLDAHVQKPANHVDNVVRVYRGKNQMARKRRLNGNLRRFGVADFTDHDFVRVVAQDRAQASREGQSLFLVNGNLRNAVQLILDWIFDCQNFIFFVPNLIQRCI